jgi:hypothetical protein
LVTLIVHRPTAHSVTPPYVPLVAPSVASMGDLALVSSSSPRMVIVPREMSAPEEPMLEALEGTRCRRHAAECHQRRGGWRRPSAR